MNHVDIEDRVPSIEYLRLIWRRRWLVLLVTLGVSGYWIFGELRTEPLYEAQVSVQLSSGSPFLLERLPLTGERSMGTSPDMEIIRSRLIAGKTAIKLRQHYALRSLPAGVSLELSGVETTEDARAGDYTIKFVDDAGNYQVLDPEGRSIGAGRPDQKFSSEGVSFTLSKVTARAGSTVHILFYSLASVANRLRGVLTVAPERNTGLVILRARANDPQQAANTANAFVESFAEFSREQKIRNLQNLRKFLAEQMEAIRRDLMERGQALGESGIEKRESESIASLFLGDRKLALAKILLDLEIQRAMLLYSYTPNHPLISRLEREIANIRGRLGQQLQVGKQDIQVQDLLRRSEFKAGLYAHMFQREQEARIQEVSESGSVRIIDRALPPEHRVRPNLTRSGIRGVMLGLGLGIGLVLLLGYMDRSVKNVKDVEEGVGLPVYGAIPEITERTRRSVTRYPSLSAGSGDTLKLLVAISETGTIIGEAYRSLRTNFQFASVGSSQRAFLFTSGMPAEGKSITVASLAISLSQLERRVLVVDADLRKPTQHTLFGLQGEMGLTDVLIHNRAWQDVTQSTRMKNVDVMPCGPLPPNPSELLAGEDMKRLLHAVRDHYDLILIDSTPVLFVSDACVLAPLVDGVFLVVRAGSTTSDAVLRCRSRFNTVNARLVGVILNAMSGPDGSGAYAGYYYREDGNRGWFHLKGRGILKEIGQRILSNIRRV